MDLSMESIGGVTVIRMIGQLWQKEDLAAFRGMIESCIERGANRVVVDVSRLTFIGSQGLGLLVHTFGKLREAGGSQVLFGPRASVLETIELSGFDMFMPIARTEQELAVAVPGVAIPGLSDAPETA